MLVESNFVIPGTIKMHSLKTVNYYERVNAEILGLILIFGDIHWRYENR